MPQLSTPRQLFEVTVPARIVGTAHFDGGEVEVRVECDFPEAERILSYVLAPGESRGEEDE